MDRGAWRGTVHSLKESDRTERLSRAHSVSPGGSVVKSLPANAGDTGVDPSSG